MLSKIFKISADKGITEEELLTWVEEAESEGGIKIEEGELIKSAIEFNDLDVTDIVTPRVDVVAVSKEDDVEDIEKDFSESGFSRLPVFDETIDDIVGIVHQKDFYSYVLRGEKTLREIIKPAIYAPPTMKISKLLKLLQKSKSHMAIITDEYGGTKGIATLEDIIEELVGEIWDEHDEISHEIEIIADNKYKIAGSAHLDKMFDYFDLPEEEDEDLEVNTVSGFVVHKLGKFPNRGDSFVYKDLHITVSKIDSRRVVEIIVIK